MKFSKRLKHYLNLVISFLMIAFIVIQVGPSFVSNLQNEGATLPRTVMNEIKSGSEIAIPLRGNSIVIFWATWCAPCKVEMNRLAQSVSAGKIPSDRILAINSFEDERTIRNFLKTDDYPFQFFANQDLAEHLSISRTPTTLFIENGTITKMSSGLSFIGIWQAELLF